MAALGFAPTAKPRSPYIESPRGDSHLSPLDRILQGFRESAIPDPLALANVHPVAGDEIVEILSEHAIEQVQRVTSFATEPAKRILSRYEELLGSSGWLAYGTTIDGGLGTVALIKPDRPRLDFEKRKRVKYETPAKAEALPILPFVDEQTAAQTYQRYGVEPQAGETFWRVVWRCNLPIAIVEGFKKALSLIAHGLPAIAIRGITQWHKKGSNELHDTIAQFATQKRKIYVVFDEDAKAQTRSDVHRERMRLLASLEQAGCIVGSPLWDGSQLGKGIDDVLFGQGDRAQTWLDDAIAKAPSLKLLRQGDRIRRAIEVLQRLNHLSYPVERATEGEYVPKLPALTKGAIHVLSASMNAGKTTRIGCDWVREAIERGWNILVVSPLNSLGEQTAEGWNIPHIHDYGNSAEQQRLLWAEVSHSHGLVLCPDSLHRLPEWFFDRPLLLILDEANQGISHTTQGDTLKSRWSDILERLTTIARHAIQTGAIILSEDGLSDRVVNFIEAISGGDTVRVFTHQKQSEPWDCTVYQGQASGFRSDFIAATDQPLLYVTTSQQEGKRLERALRKQRPNLKVVRIDSETNQGGKFSSFFKNPDRWLEVEQPDVLILSPSAKSGISIQGNVAIENAYFAQVWGYFPALATDSQMQLLGRYRPAVPRVIFCPPFILSSGDEALLYPRAIGRQMRQNAKLLSGVYALDELLTAEGERAELLATIETAVQSYLCAEIAANGAQKLMAHAALVSRLEASGHDVKEGKCIKNPAIVELWRSVTEELWREDAAAFAAAEITDKHSPEWAHRAIESQDASLEARILARKVLMREEFPGVAFDDAEECYQAICKDYGAMRRGVTLQAKAENLDAAKAIDRTATEAILSKNIRALHRLPKSAVRSVLIAKTGILALLDGSSYHNRDERAIAVKSAALKFRPEISYWLRLQINEAQTPVEVVNKLLRKLSLKAAAIARPGSRGQQNDRHWQVAGYDDPVRVQLLEAARRKLSEPVSTICNREKTYLQIVDTNPEKPQLKLGDRVRCGLGEAEIFQIAADGYWCDGHDPQTGRRFAAKFAQVEAIA